jgi:hypothetical protein
LPHRTLAGRVLLVVVALTASVLAWNVVVIRNAAEAFEARHGALHNEATVNIREASVISVTKNWISGGQPLTVTTTLGLGYLQGETVPGETLEAWKERHRLKVAEVQILFPPD